MNGLTFDRFSTRFFPMRLVTSDGYRSTLEGGISGVGVRARIEA
jgi:hypothetical protein